jgi:hypothetical protein
MYKTIHQMKKIMTLTAAVLCSALAFADAAKDFAGSSISVTNSGSSLIKVFYKSQKYSTVTVSILNANKEKVFSERMKGDNFVRPYNFKNLPAGHYTIQIEDADGTHSEDIDYTIAESKKVNVAKVAADEQRYLISGFLPTAEKVSIKVYDADNKIINQEQIKVEGKFQRLYNLSAIKGAFSIEVSDVNGSLLDFHAVTGK